MIDVSIIIVNYNTYQVTKNCIDSIFHHTKDINFEIILVDNNSQDESYTEFIKDNRIKYLYQSVNLGFGKANNIGFEQAKGKYLFLLNSDTILKNNGIKYFYDFMENTSNDIACVGTLLKDNCGKITHSYGNFPTLYSGLLMFTILGGIKKRLGFSTKLKIKENVVDYITGADLFIKKEIAEKYGLFDPDFFMYYEETELQYRYRKNGFKSIIYDKPEIIHLENYSVNISTENRNMRKKIMFFESYCLYLKKTKGYINYFIFKSVYFFLSVAWLMIPQYSFKEKINYIKKTLY